MKKILVLGSLNMDYAIQTARMPRLGETILGTSVKLAPGGKGANQAYAIGKLGGNVEMLGAVGKDNYGEKLIQNLQQVKVGVSGIEILSEVETGQAFISVVDDGNNAIVVIPGANGVIDKKMIDRNMRLIENCEYIIMQMEIPLDIVRYVKEVALSKGKKVILDPAPAVGGLDDDFFYGISLLKPNETELSILSGRLCNTQEEILSASRMLLKKGVGNVIVTMGEKGCLMVNEKEEKFFPAFKVKCVDTTAAGDSFIAALVVALSEGKGYQEAITFAQKISAIVVTRNGAQSSVPCRAEVEKTKIGRE